MTVSLIPITKDNWRACIRLKVAEEQKTFVATNAQSLAQAAYETQWRPYGIYDGDTMVGFIMYGLEHFEGRALWVILRLLVATDHQNKGYGGAAILAALENIRQDESPVRDVYISFVPENAAARHLYAKLGFKDAGKTPDGSEDLMHMRLD